MSAWESVKLGNVTQRAETWNPRSAPDEIFKYIDLSSVDSTAKSITSATLILGTDAPSRARQLVKHEDVIVSTVRPNLNAVARVPRTHDGATASTGFSVLRPTPRIYSKYLHFWTRSPRFIGDMVRKATGANYPAVTDRVVRDSIVPLPPLAEQRRIASILDEADAIRTKRRTQLTLIGELPQTIFESRFGLATHDSMVGDVADIQGGLQVSSKRESLPDKASYLRVANVHRGRLDLREIKSIGLTQPERERTRLKRGDLLFVEGHANPNEVGRVALWDGSIDDCVHQNHLIRARVDSSVAHPAFMEAWLNSSRGREHFRKAGKTTSGLNTISASTVRSAPTPLPPLAIQQEFAELVTTIHAERDRVARALETDEELFAALQHRAFRGEL